MSRGDTPQHKDTMLRKPWDVCAAGVIVAALALVAIYINIEIFRYVKSAGKNE
jgi:hypothetical protein